MRISFQACIAVALATPLVSSFSPMPQMGRPLRSSMARTTPMSMSDDASPAGGISMPDNDDATPKAEEASPAKDVSPKVEVASPEAVVKDVVVPAEEESSKTEAEEVAPAEEASPKDNGEEVAPAEEASPKDNGEEVAPAEDVTPEAEATPAAEASPPPPPITPKVEEEGLLDCLVIGGGISGSTLAHNLNRAGKKILLAEARDYLGGNVKSQVTEIDGIDGEFIWEMGPNSFAAQPSIVRIAYELGIDDQLVFADEALPPWVNHNGKLHPLPKGKGGKGPKGQIELVFGSNGVLKFGLLGGLLSWPGKIRAGIGAFLGHAEKPEGKDETIREWVTRILGEEVFLRCIDPFVSGVYAGDPETLSMKASLSKIARIEDIAYSIDWNKFGAIFYGGLKRQVALTKERKADPPAAEWVDFEYGNPGSFKRGLSTLPNAIAEELGQPVGTTTVGKDSKVRLQWKVQKVEKDGDVYEATFDTPSGPEVVRAKTVVSTIPAHALGGVVETLIPKTSMLVKKIRSDIKRKGIYHPPLYAVTVAYPKTSFLDVELDNDFGNLQNLPGFGSLNPRSEGVRTLGTLWSSSLFPGRCPPDYNLLLNYIGGSRDPGIAELTEEEVIAEVDKGCRQVLLKPNAPEPKVMGLKLWPTAIPQYELGHLEMIKELDEAEKEAPGLWVCGNYRTGVAFPDCVTYGYEHAKVVTKYLDEM